MKKRLADIRMVLGNGLYLCHNQNVSKYHNHNQKRTTMDKELIKSLLPTMQIEFKTDSFSFKKRGRHHWVYMRPWDGKFEATRNGRDFQDTEAFDTLEEAIEWIGKIFKYL